MPGCSTTAGAARPAMPRSESPSTRTARSRGPGAGKWRLRDGTLQLSFDGGPAKYGGTIDGNVASGAMSTFGGLSGSWYLVKQGTVGIEPEAGRRNVRRGRQRAPGSGVSARRPAASAPGNSIGSTRRASMHPHPTPPLDLLHPAASHAGGDRPIGRPRAPRLGATDARSRHDDAQRACHRAAAPRPERGSGDAAQGTLHLLRQPRDDPAGDVGALGGPGRDRRRRDRRSVRRLRAPRSISTGTSSSGTRSTTPVRTWSAPSTTARTTTTRSGTARRWCSATATARTSTGSPPRST